MEPQTISSHVWEKNSQVVTFVTKEWDSHVSIQTFWILFIPWKYGRIRFLIDAKMKCTIANWRRKTPCVVLPFSSLWASFYIFSVTFSHYCRTDGGTRSLSSNYMRTWWKQKLRGGYVGTFSNGTFLLQKCRSHRHSRVCGATPQAKLNALGAFILIPTQASLMEWPKRARVSRLQCQIFTSIN